MMQNKFFHFFTKFGEFCLKNTEIDEKWKNLFFIINSFNHRIMSFYPILTLIPYLYFSNCFHTFEIWEKLDSLSVSFKFDKITVEENFIFPIFEMFFSRSEKSKFDYKCLCNHVQTFLSEQGYQELSFDGF